MGLFDRAGFDAHEEARILLLLLLPLLQLLIMIVILVLLMLIPAQAGDDPDLFIKTRAAARRTGDGLNYRHAPHPPTHPTPPRCRRYGGGDGGRPPPTPLPHRP